MTIWERVSAALQPLGVDMAPGTYLGEPGQLPDLFLTYFLISAPPEQHANDSETLRSYNVQVTAYSRNGLASLPDITGAMKAAGFTPGSYRELPFNQVSGHYILALDFNYLE